jgi:DNA-binding beta-propeller fold protein YncE
MFTTVGVGSNPFQVRFHPDDTKLYVGTATTGVHVINTSLASVTIPAPNDENGLAFSPSACKLYVSSLDLGQITEIDTHADTVLRTVTIGDTPQELAVSPDSSELWVADEDVGVKIYTLPSLTYSATVPGTAGAWGLAMSPDGQQLYATLPEPGTIKIISRTGRNVVTTLTAGKPRRVAFDFSGAHAVVADEILGAILIR